MSELSSLADFAISARESLIQRGTESGAMPAVSVQGFSDAFFALEVDGTFHLLLKVPSGLIVSEYRTSVIEFASGAELTVLDGSTRLQGTFARISLGANFVHLTGSFGALAGMLLSMVPVTPNVGEIERLFRDFESMFSASPVVERSTLLGLWGELWLLDSARDPETLAAGWHDQRHSIFDFSFLNARLEIKTTERAARGHVFALAQLEQQDRPTWIASIWAMADAGGYSIEDLLARIGPRLTAASRAHVIRGALSVLGGDIEAAADFRWAPRGLNACVLLDARLIPRVVVPEAAPISEIHFHADLTQVAALSGASLDDVLAELT
ncbi:PD-(D/E)XK motif protein [Plantibacter sp. T3]|uniref:PD-(D/E)XK motif protein n=1 Tax=Plantibacter sp. T3 TaxID=2653161 RepID=UPI0012F2A78A|nr:PD-(D/E)XK motif protein [Plantibacter sp. T3]VXB08475.1 conserved hypothetical protein [Plantibacter sp. T3]